MSTKTAYIAQIKGLSGLTVHALANARCFWKRNPSITAPLNLLISYSCVLFEIFQ